MVIEKQCSRCRKETGDLDPEGNKVFFRIGYNRCDRCTRDNKARNSRILEERRLLYPTPFNNIVYGFKENGEFIYIGSSKDGPLRIWEHMEKKSMKSIFHTNGINKLYRKMNFTWHVIWNGDDGDNDTRLYQEKELIKLHKPKYNKTWVKES